MSYSSRSVIGLDVTTLTLALTRGSTMKLRPVFLETVWIGVLQVQLERLVGRAGRGREQQSEQHQQPGGTARTVQ